MDRTTFERHTAERIKRDSSLILADLYVGSTLTHHIAAGRVQVDDGSTMLYCLETSNDDNPNSGVSEFIVRQDSELAPARGPNGEIAMQTRAGLITIAPNSTPTLQIPLTSIAVYS